MTTLRRHWPEYVSEFVCLTLFMLSAAGFATLLQHPDSRWVLHGVEPGGARFVMGLAMGLTAVAIIYSPLGARSGAHMNPAVTLAFLRLGKIAPFDAAWYIAAQMAAGIVGILAATALLGGWPSHSAVNYVATVPGPPGTAAAFIAELTISFGLLLVVLVMSNSRYARFTGLCAGALVCLYITVESPISGMSMNAARSFGPAILAGTLDSFWIYAVAPLAGMLLAAEAFVRARGSAAVLCAKLHHAPGVPCIFRCRFGMSASPIHAPVRAIHEVSA